VLRQLWQLNEAWKLYRRSGPTDHELIIRTRPDLWFSGFVAEDLERMTADALTPWWGRFGGINDRFAIMVPYAAEAYFTTFARLPMLADKGVPLHPETLVRVSMEAAGCQVNDRLRVEFSTVRENGEVRAPEIGPIDLAHAALGKH
jgi:hypothetical protein